MFVASGAVKIMNMGVWGQGGGELEEDGGPDPCLRRKNRAGRGNECFHSPSPGSQQIRDRAATPALCKIKPSPSLLPREAPSRPRHRRHDKNSSECPHSATLPRITCFPRPRSIFPPARLVTTTNLSTPHHTPLCLSLPPTRPRRKTPLAVHIATIGRNSSTLSFF